MWSIADEFKKEHGVSVTVEVVEDPYDLKQLISKHLADSDDAYDVMEVDTVMLGQLAKSGNLQALLEEYFEVTRDVFASSAVESVSYAPHLKSHLYGVPTLQCAKFLMELADVDHSPEDSLLKDWISFDQLKEALDQEEESGHRILLVGDFRGRWGLPTLYLDAYVSRHGNGSLLEGIDGPLDDLKLIEELKEFTDYGRLEDGSNPGTDGKFHEDHELFIREVADSKHILMYAYSENMGEALQRAAERNKHKSTLHIISPPFQSNNLLTYTDAAVVNKYKFADPKRAADVIKFVEFYTSLPFRTSFAFGQDLPPSVLYPRYVLPARNDFSPKRLQ